MSNMNKKISQPELRLEIIAMVEVDQEMIKGNNFDKEINKKHTERMKEIINKYGWPTKSMVGSDAAHGAWLLVQHSDYDVDFQKKAVELVTKASDKGEADKKILGYLIDRVRVNSGKPQLFGTQFYKDQGGKYGPKPIEDPENLEARRKDYQMEPFLEYEKRMREIFDQSRKSLK